MGLRLVSFRGRLADVRRVLEKDDVRALSRRYFVANGFDGTLTSIGVVIGAYLGGVTDGVTIVGIGLGAAVGLGTSGIWSVWEIERAETSRARKELEDAMLTSLDDTQLSRDLRTAQILHALASGTGPVLAVLLTLAPLLLEGVVLSIEQAVLGSIAVGILLLASVGAYMGSISQQRWYVAAVRMGLAGIVVAVLSILLPG